MSDYVENRGLEEELFKKIVHHSKNMQALRNLNITLKYLAPGRAGSEMVVDRCYSNSRGTAHGGIIATFVDTVMGFACITLDLLLVTLEMNLNYFAPVQIGEKISAEAEVIHAGKTTVVAEAVVYNSSKKIVSKSRGTFFPVGKISEQDGLSSE